VWSWFDRKPRRGEAMGAVGGASVIGLGVGWPSRATRAENICWLRAVHPYSDLVTRQLSRVLASHDVARENGDARLRHTLRTPYDI
jgi:hypothetical protein